LAVTALGALLAFSTTGLATSSSDGDSESCKGNEYSSQSVRKAKTNDPKPKPPVSCPTIEVEKKAEKDEYKKGDTIKWTVTIENKGKKDVKVSVEDEGVKLYGPGGSEETSKKAKTKTKKSSCEGSKQSSSKKAKSSTKKNEDCDEKDKCDEGSGYQSKSSSKDCDKPEKCGGLIAPGEAKALVCTGSQVAEKCGTVKNTVEVTAYSVKSKDDKDKDKKDKSKKSKTSSKPGKVVVEASDETFVLCDLKVEKTATLSYVKTWDWTITKKADTLKKNSTDATATIEYTVEVKKSETPAPSNVKVVGDISVHNPYWFTIKGATISDKLGSVECQVDGGATKDLVPGASTFGYVCMLEAVPAPGAKNVATAAFMVNGKPGTATGEASLSEGQITEVDGSVKVTDWVYKLLGLPGSATDGPPVFPEAAPPTIPPTDGIINKTTTFTYTRTYNVPATNCVSYKNIAKVASLDAPSNNPPKGDDEKTTGTDTTYSAASGNYGTTTSTPTTPTGTETKTETETTPTGPYTPPATSKLPKDASVTVEICRAVQDLAVNKTATTKIENDWTITKSTTTTSPINATVVPQPISYNVVLTKTPKYTVSGTITVTNPNPFPVTSVTVTDKIGTTDCVVTNGAVGTLAAGASATPAPTYTCSVATSDPGTNSASVSFTDPGNVVKSVPATVGYSFLGVTPLHDAVKVTDVFDGQPETIPAASVTTPPAAPISYTRNAEPPVAIGCRPVLNTATLTALDDPNYTKNSPVTVEVCRTAATPPPTPPAGFGNVGGSGTTAGTPANRAALALSKTGPGAATAGQLVSYRIKVTNRSKIAARNVVLRDILPSGFSVSGKLKGASISKGRISWKVGTLAPGKSRTVGVKLRIDRSVGGRRCNQAVATAGNAKTVRDTQCTRIAAVAGAVEPGVTG
jgi:uncharacterized repeat protein (TIGR01451 family)